MFRFFAVCIAQILLVSSVCVATTQVGRSQQPRRPFGVPEATLPCTPEEQAWWAELRAAAEDVKHPHKPSEKQKKKFLDVLRNGVEKSYKPPVPDGHWIVLWKTEPQYTEQARRAGINGTVVIKVELLANGAVGTVEVIEGLPQGLSEAAADAARKTIFLPAVKNRQFVTESIQMVMTFNLY